MITNERQYRITRKKALGFARAIDELDARSHERTNMHPRLLPAEREAMESQLADLHEEIEEYEQLKSADLSVISVATFDELAVGLIKARVAAGLSQRTLAQRLEIKEQQIQRYEAERYASASYRRLCRVARALGVRIENEILLPVVPGSFEGLLTKVSQVGLSREFLVGRLLSSADAAIADGVEAFLDERGRRMWAAAESRAIGYGGDALVSDATGLSRVTIRAGRRELESGGVERGRVRRPGAGRPGIERSQPGIKQALERLVDPLTRGDPRSPLRWTCKSRAKLTACNAVSQWSLRQAAADLRDHC